MGLLKKVGNIAKKAQTTITTGGLNLLKPKGSSAPGFDFGSLEQRAQQSADEQRKYLQDDLTRRRQIISGLGGKLQPLSNQFKTERGQIGTDLTGRTEQALGQFKTDMEGLNQADMAANAAAVNTQQERAFRTLPAQQQMLKELLAGQGMLRTGAATRRLAEPVQQAARSVSDFGQDLENQRLAQMSRRGENVALAGLDTRKQVALQRMGLDSDTINYLTQIGRQDIIDEASSLAGLSKDEAQGLSGISQGLVDVLNQTDIARQSQNVAQAQQKASERSALLRSLLSIGGMAGGFALGGGPMGASLGGQLGQMAGGLATGQEVSPNPALLFALQRQPRYANTRSFGQTPIR